ncbi:MAG: hypothetical protein ACJASM_001226 [Salibacteraceae bacterium]|jgi:hypothetical protein|tara:strand:+ start:177 stop:917 length:741 start_codon:yes stop_codon:yes gene_type:complete
MGSSNSLKADTKKQQQLLAEYCRTGNIPMGLMAKPERLPHYRRLVYNVIYDTLASAYPITKAYLGKEKWKLLVDDFFKNFPNQNAQIWRMPYGLFEYLNDYPNPHSEAFPFLAELVYFEWLEIELYAEKDLALKQNSSTLDSVNLNPHHRIIQLKYPFHFLSVDEAIKAPKTTFIVLFRNLENYKIEFSEVSVLVAKVLEALPENNFDFLHSMKKVAAQYNLTDIAIIEKQADKLLIKFKQLGLFL